MKTFRRFVSSYTVGWVASVSLALFAILFWPGHGAAQQSVQNGPRDPDLFSGLKWRMIGPFRAGRAVAATGVPGQPNHFYFGSVGGGVWESTNAGESWTPIFDKEDVASIGAIAVAPSDPNVIYVGSGEADVIVLGEV